MKIGMTSEKLKRALARTAGALLATNAAEAVVARHQAELSTPEDAELAATQADRLLGEQEADGSWGGDLLATAEALLLLSDLVSAGAPASEGEAVRRALSWLRGRRSAPGRFGDGCTAERHRLGFCHHFVGGFFAPVPPQATSKEVVLGSGARLRAGSAALLAASCVALQSVLRRGIDGVDAQLHLDALRRLIRLDPREARALLPIEVLPATLAALVEAPATAENRAAIERGLGRIVQSQRADGSWPELDTFYILEVLLAAVERGYRKASLEAAIRRAAGLLAVTQQPDGTWERGALPRRTVIGWRTLRYAVGATSGELELANEGR